MTYSLLPCLCAQPQKPYNVLGTLADQMTYPDEHAGELSREALFEVLEQVDLTYLLERDGVMVNQLEWLDPPELPQIAGNAGP